MPKITLFNGTAHAFDAFDERFILRGKYPNNALGIHLTKYPSVAAEYAGFFDIWSHSRQLKNPD
jgi:hypothetical protein